MPLSRTARVPEESTGPFEYLSLEDVLDIYCELFDYTTQQAFDLLRDAGGLESGLGRLRHWSHYEQADLATQAAVLAHAVAEGQHFLEGNKRTGLVAMRTFLLLNGFDVKASQEDMFSWILGLSRRLTVRGLAQEIRRTLIRLED